MAEFIFYAGPINQAGARNCQILLTPFISLGDAADVTLCINSRGGDLEAGMGLANFIGMLPFKIKTHNYGSCGSIAANVYLEGHVRSVDPMSRFALHAASLLETGAIAPSTDLLREHFAARLDWSEARLDEYFLSTQDKQLTPDHAIATSLAHEIKRLSIAKSDHTMFVGVPDN